MQKVSDGIREKQNTQIKKKKPTKNPSRMIYWPLFGESSAGFRWKQKMHVSSKSSRYYFGVCL